MFREKPGAPINLKILTNISQLPLMGGIRKSNTSCVSRLGG